MLIDEMFSTLRFTMFGFSIVTFLLYEFIVAFTYFKTAERKRDYLAYTEGGKDVLKIDDALAMVDDFVASKLG